MESVVSVLIRGNVSVGVGGRSHSWSTTRVWTRGNSSDCWLVSHSWSPTTVSTQNDRSAGWIVSHSWSTTRVSTCETSVRILSRRRETRGRKGKAKKTKKEETARETRRSLKKTARVGTRRPWGGRSQIHPPPPSLLPRCLRVKAGKERRYVFWKKRA